MVFASRLYHSSTCLVASDLTVMSPLALTSSAPWAASTAPATLIESVQVLSPSPNGCPPLAHFSAAVMKVSHVQLSTSSLSGVPPGPGYIFCRSSPTYSLNMSIRAQGGSELLP